VLLQGRERVLKKKLPQEEGNFIRTGREREFEKVYFFKLLYGKSTYQNNTCIFPFLQDFWGK